MKPISSEGLDWIPRAPVSVTRTRRIAADRDRVWAAIADHERWPEWFTALSGVERIDAADGVGGHRRVHLGRITVEEEFLAWEPGERFAFVVTHCSAPILRSMVEDVQLTAEDSGATTVSYTQAIHPKGTRLVAPLVRRMAPRTIDQGLAGLAAFTEG